jgi:transitional endoplasmic reticulum ATPase
MAGIAVVESKQPDFVRAISQDYKSQISHVFILHGNVYDFCDNSGKDLTVQQAFNTAYDDAFQKDISEYAAKDKVDIGISDDTGKTAAKITRIMATYNISRGLEFPHPASLKAIQSLMAEKLGELVNDKFMRPVSVGKLIEFMNLWFNISKARTKENFKNKEEGKTVLPELLVTWIIQDADSVFPNGDIANLGPDRTPIVSIRQWAQDEWLGFRNRIVLMTRHASDLHSSIRSEISSIHMVRKPNLADRLAYITDFDNTVKMRAKNSKTGKVKVSDNTSVTGINWAEGFDGEQCAIQSAGMNRKQLKDVFLQSWINQQPVDYSGITQRKQRALLDEYQGMLDFKEPTFGFEEIGGHEHFKNYCRQRIITPLKERDTKTCSRGALMTGPPGTGKSMLALALAKEAQLNFMQVDLGKVFAGLVGETEKNMRKLIEAIEAAAPCIVFIDEVDSVLSAGRSSGGDSGTSGRVFNSFMTFLSDPGRVGRVVVLMASNRPDMLDTALIRDGRMDAKIPILPPSKDDAVGRKAIIKALLTKHNIAFSPDLAGTMTDADNGLGRLLLDEERTWTGAEIESLLRKSMSSAAFAGRKTKDGKKDYTIQAADWNHAMDVIIPNTGEVDIQIGLALRFVNDLDYCPKAYWPNVKAEQERYRQQLVDQERQAA